MNLEVQLNGRPFALKLDRDGDIWRATLQGEERTASVLEVEPGIYSVLIDGRSFEARVERGIEGLVVNVGPSRFVAEVNDPRRLSRKSRAAGRGGRQTVASPMPGKVVRVLAAEGQQVEAGQGLIVVEAMKMQNEMKAPKSGRVASLAAREGATVAAGEVLVVID